MSRHAVGVEALTLQQRYAKALDAGVDQFRGVSDSDLIVKLVREKTVPESRIDLSATRILKSKFELGLFENPYVDLAVATSTVGSAEFMDAPHQLLHPGYFFGSRQHEGDLDFKPGDAKLVEFEALSKKLPTIVAIYLDRPAILTPIVEGASAVLANFSASDEALLAVVTGKAQPQGGLPFELPSSMAAVTAQKSDTPHDSATSLFPIRFGLRYEVAR